MERLTYLINYSPRQIAEIYPELRLKYWDVKSQGACTNGLIHAIENFTDISLYESSKTGLSFLEVANAVDDYMKRSTMITDMITDWSASLSIRFVHRAMYQVICDYESGLEKGEQCRTHTSQQDSTP